MHDTVLGTEEVRRQTEPAVFHEIHNTLRHGITELDSRVIIQELDGKRKAHCFAYVATTHCVPKRAIDTFLNLRD